MNALKTYEMRKLSIESTMWGKPVRYKEPLRLSHAKFGNK